MLYNQKLHVRELFVHKTFCGEKLYNLSVIVWHPTASLDHMEKVAQEIEMCAVCKERLDIALLANAL